MFNKTSRGDTSTNGGPFSVNYRPQIPPIVLANSLARQAFMRMADDALAIHGRPPVGATLTHRNGFSHTNPLNFVAGIGNHLNQLPPLHAPQKNPLHHSNMNSGSFNPIISTAAPSAVGRSAPRFIRNPLYPSQEHSPIRFRGPSSSNHSPALSQLLSNSNNSNVAPVTQSKTHFRCVLCPFTASKADRVYRHYTRMHSLARGTGDSQPSAPQVTAHVSLPSQIAADADRLSSQNIVNSYRSLVESSLSLPKQSNGTTTRSEIIDHVEATDQCARQVVSHVPSVPLVSRSCEVRFDRSPLNSTPASTSLLAQCLGIAVPNASQVYPWQPSRIAAPNVRKSSELPDLVPLHPDNGASLLLDSSVSTGRASSVLREEISSSHVKFMSVNTSSRPGSTSKNQPEDFIFSPLSSPDTASSTTSSSSVVMLELDEVGQKEARETVQDSSIAEPNTSTNTEVPHSAGRDAPPPSDIAPTISDAETDCPNNKRQRVRLNSHTSTATASPKRISMGSPSTSLISSLADEDEDDLIFLGFQLEGKTAHRKLCICLTYKQGEVLTDCPRCHGVHEPPSFSDVTQTTTPSEQSKVNIPTSLPQDKNDENVIQSEQEEEKALDVCEANVNETASEPSTSHHASIEKNSCDLPVTTPPTDTCDETIPRLTVGCTLSTNEQSVDSRPSTLLTIAQSEPFRHSLRKSPLQPIPIDPSELISVEPEAIQPTDRITVDMLTGEVYVDGEPLRALVHGVRLNRIVPWREEPSLASRSNARRGRFPMTGPSRKNKRSDTSNKIVRHISTRRSVIPGVPTSPVHTTSTAQPHRGRPTVTPVVRKPPERRSKKRSRSTDPVTHPSRGRSGIRLRLTRQQTPTNASEECAASYASDLVVSHSTPSYLRSSSPVASVCTTDGPRCLE